MRKNLTIEEKEAKRLYDIEYRKKNKENVRQRSEKWRENNPDKVKENNLNNI